MGRENVKLWSGKPREGTVAFAVKRDSRRTYKWEKRLRERSDHAVSGGRLMMDAGHGSGSFGL